jgi:hypothetical protein
LKRNSKIEDLKSYLIIGNQPKVKPTGMLTARDKFKSFKIGKTNFRRVKTSQAFYQNPSCSVTPSKTKRFHFTDSLAPISLEAKSIDIKMSGYQGLEIYKEDEKSKMKLTYSNLSYNKKYGNENLIKKLQNKIAKRAKTKIDRSQFFILSEEEKEKIKLAKIGKERFQFK